MGSLGKRLFLLFSMITLLCLLIMMAQGIHCSHRAVHKAAHVYLLSVAKCKQEHFDLWLKERALDIKMLSETSCLTACCSKEFSEEGTFCSIFYSIQNRSSAFKCFSIYETSGKKLFTTGMSTFEFSQSELFQITSKLSLKNKAYWDYSGLPQVKVVCRINNNQQLMLVEMDFTKILQDLVHHDIALGTSDKITITDSSGKVLAENVKQTRVSPQRISKEIRMAEIGITITAMIPEKEAMAEMYLYIEYAIVTVFATLLLMFFVIWKISWDISRPILKIAATARKITEGNLKERVDYQGKDEISTLIQDFNYMADCLVANQNSMQEKHQQLQNAYNKIEETKQQLIKIEALAATGKMAASIVHEIRNPLSTIKMNLQILIRALGKETKYHEHGYIAIQQLEHLGNMLTDLLNYSRPITLTREPCSLSSIISAAVEMVSAEIEKHQVSIDYSVPEISVVCDSEKLEQAISNIILNAIQASSTLIEISVQRNEKYITLNIKDDGKGICAENLENIFEPFFSLRKNGIGLGLSYVKKIVQLHGCVITVESNLKQGSCFSIELPQKLVV